METFRFRLTPTQNSTHEIVMCVSLYVSDEESLEDARDRALERVYLEYPDANVLCEE